MLGPESFQNNDKRGNHDQFIPVGFEHGEGAGDVETRALFNRIEQATFGESEHLPSKITADNVDELIRSGIPIPDEVAAEVKRGGELQLDQQ